ncbi:MAG: hypothetical protein LRZ97_01170, partial [Candidatus Pacebacteria bacterium]|nr:hypothetical protein [Candidatus Paceibacterota bacterium]
IKFLIGAGLLWGAIRIATMLASQATSSMGGLGKSINGLMNILPGALEGAAARGLGVGTYGLAGLAGRGILGRGANRVSGGLSSMADRTKSRFWQRRLNELSNNSALKNMANASYDGRQSKATQEFMKKSGINLGAGIKDGFKKIRDDRTKKEEKHDKSHIEAVRESLEVDRESQAATQTAKDSQEKEQKEVGKKIQSKNKEIEKLENENDKKMSDELAAESNQTKKVEQRKAAVEDIKADKEAASHTVAESTAQIATETNKIKSIKKELTKKSKRLEDLTLGGSLNIDTAEITNLKAEIDNLNNDNTSSMNRRAGHEERLYEAESTLKESAMRETELHDAQAELRLIQSNNHISREAREKDLVSKKVEKGSLVDDNSELTQSIKEHIEVLSDYRNKFTEALSKTRIVRDAPKLSNKDVAWLTGKGVRFDDKQEVVRMPNSFIMRSMPDVEKAMLNKLLTQNKKYHTTISGEFKKLEKTKKQLKEEEVNKTFRARFADTSAESIADILNKSNNVNDDKPKPEKEAGTKEEEEDAKK